MRVRKFVRRLIATMASRYNRGADAAELALAERQVSDWDDSYTVLWQEWHWLAELVVAQINASDARVSWH